MKKDNQKKVKVGNQVYFIEKKHGDFYDLIHCVTGNKKYNVSKEIMYLCETKIIIQTRPRRMKDSSGDWLLRQNKKFRRR